MLKKNYLLIQYYLKSLNIKDISYQKLILKYKKKKIKLVKAINNNNNLYFLKISIVIKDY